MLVALAAAFFFAILTLWVPAFWPVTVFQLCVFVLAGVAAYGWRNRPPRFSWPLAPLSFAVALGLFQRITGRTVYAFETENATVRWFTFLAVFLTGVFLFRESAPRRWFRSAMLWFSFAIAMLALLQTFSSQGKVFWIFPTGYRDYVMGPIVYHNHYAAFIEVVLPVALYEAFRRERGSLLYAGVAAALYASVIASASRAGTALATAEIVVVAALMWARHQAERRTVGLVFSKIALLAVLFTAVAGWQAVWSRALLPDPYGGRREFAVSTIRMTADRPWVGFGLGVWPVVYPGYATIDLGLFANRAHSDWLEWTAEGGLPLGIMMFTLFLRCLRPAFRSVWGLGVVAVFLHAAVDYPFSRPALGSWPILILAMLAARQASETNPRVAALNHEAGGS
jgi:O-antigen ligase